MGEIARSIICRNCSKIRNVEDNIISEGITENGIMYYITRPQKIYLMDESYTPSKNFRKNDFFKICYKCTFLEKKLS